MPPRIKLSANITLVLVLVITVLVYWPGLSGGFLFDDYANIVHNDRVRLTELSPVAIAEASYSGLSGPFMKRTLSMLSFSLNYYFTGLDPYYFKLTNLILHLINGVLVYLLCVGLFSAGRRLNLIGISPSYGQWIAIAVAAAWLLHPLNLTGVLYIVQRMAQLAMTFMLLGLVIYIASRLRILAGNGHGLGVWIGLPVCTLLAALSKENGVLLLPLAFLVEALFFRFAGKDGKIDKALILFYLAVLVIPGLILLIYILMQPGWLFSGYANRDFSMAERLLSQPRIIWSYIKQLVLPDIGSMSLYHDSFQISRSLLDPRTTLFSGISLVALLTIAVWSWRCAVVLSFGLLFFFVGHSMESTVLPLELIFEHRNYLPGIGILLIVFYYLLSSQVSHNTLKLRWVGAVLLLAVFSASTAIRADQWGDNLRLSIYEVERNPYSVRTNFQAAREHAVLIEFSTPEVREELYERSRLYYLRSIDLDPELIEGYTALIALNSRNDKPVEAEWLASLLRLAGGTNIGPGGSIALKNFLECHARSICDVSDGYMDSLIFSISENEKLRPSRAANIYSSISLYLWRDRDQAELALWFSRQAYQLGARNLQAQLNYAYMLAASENIEDARKILREVQDNKQSLFYAEQINNISKYINNKTDM